MLLASELIRKDIDKVAELNEGPMRNFGMAAGISAGLLTGSPGSTNAQQYVNVANNSHQQTEIKLSPDAEKIIKDEIDPFCHSLSSRVKKAVFDHIREPRSYVQHWKQKYPNKSDVKMLDLWMQRAEMLSKVVFWGNDN